MSNVGRAPSKYIFLRVGLSPWFDRLLPQVALGFRSKVRRLLHGGFDFAIADPYPSFWHMCAKLGALDTFVSVDNVQSNHLRIAGALKTFQSISG